MKRSFFLVALAISSLFPSVLWAQASPPHIAYVYPAGGQRGTRFEVKLGGQYLNEASQVEISGTGVTASIVRQTRPLRPQEIASLRTQLQGLNEKPDKTTADEQEIEAIRELLAKAEIPISPVLAENVFVAVTIAKDAIPGPRELRLQAKSGISNPVVFDVGQLPEFRQKKESFDPEARPRSAVSRNGKARKFVAESEFSVTLPGTFNSQLLPGQVDSYRFQARKDQQLVFRTRARALIPYLADAVPGWIQAVLALYDPDGNEVASSAETANGLDPVLAFKVPSDGEYVLQIHDSLYRGREDFVYRIEAGEIPHIVSIFPLGGQVNVKTEVTLNGWNLPQKSLMQDAKDMKIGRSSLLVQRDGLQSNSVPFMVSTLPSCREQEPNNSIATAQKISLYTVVEGRIDKPGDLDVFCFEGRLGQVIVAEIWARRLGSPLDSFIKLTNAEGKTLAFNDDFDDRGQGLLTHQADSRIQATLPKDGTYFVHISDTQHHGGPAHAYRLRLSQPRPDFELRITPCSINAKPGSTVPVTVYALRRDGFAGEINLFLKKAPKDITLEGAKIPAKQNEIRMTLRVPAAPQPKPIALEIEGRAIIGDETVKRPAIPAEEMMQAFAYHHLVAVDHLVVTVSNDAVTQFPARLLQTHPIKIRPGGTALVRIAIPGNAGGQKLQVFLNEPPEGITLKRSEFTNEGVILELHADSEKAKPGLKTNVIAQVFPDLGKAGKPSQNPLGTLPAIAIEILRPNR